MQHFLLQPKPIIDVRVLPDHDLNPANVIFETTLGHHACYALNTNPRNTLFGAYLHDSEQLAGVCVVEFPPTCNGYVSVEYLATTPTLQRKHSIGSTLMRHIEQQAEAARYIGVTVEPLPKAEEFYRKLGYKEPSEATPTERILMGGLFFKNLR